MSLGPCFLGSPCTNIALARSYRAFSASCIAQHRLAAHSCTPGCCKSFSWPHNTIVAVTGKVSVLATDPKRSNEVSASRVRRHSKRQRGSCLASASVCEAPRPASSQPDSYSVDDSVWRTRPDPVGVPDGLLPRHVAVIMDGNGRWAQGSRRSVTDGHRSGVHALRRTVACCLAWGIPSLTVFAFSAENWRRSREEVRFLMGLIERVIAYELDNLAREGVRLNFIGDRNALPPSLADIISRAERQTVENDRLQLTVALSYGGRQDITHAAKRIAKEIACGTLNPSQVTEEVVEERLAMGVLPKALRNPDLLIRTSGELRLSNFLLWELAYCELFFCQTRWPDFGEADFREALQHYSVRHRRFGQRA